MILDRDKGRWRIIRRRARWQLAGPHGIVAELATTSAALWRLQHGWRLVQVTWWQVEPDGETPVWDWDTGQRVQSIPRRGG